VERSVSLSITNAMHNFWFALATRIEFFHSQNLHSASAFARSKAIPVPQNLPPIIDLSVQIWTKTPKRRYSFPQYHNV
jgi:hypothetical protein